MKKERPLLKCSIVHSIRGRVRIRCRAVKYLSKYRKDIEKNIGNVSYVNKANVEVITSGVLVYYDFDVVDADEVREIVESIIADYSIPAYQKEKKERSKMIVEERRLDNENSDELLKRLAVTIGGLATHRLTGDIELISGIGFLSRFTNVSSILSLFLSRPIIKSGIKSIVKAKRPNADTLTATSIIVALMTGRGFSALTTILLSDIAEYLTVCTMNKTKKAVKDMLDTGEKNVWKRGQSGNFVNIPSSKIETGDIILHQTGDKVSIDGTIVKGSAVIDQSMITGEFMPESKNAGSSVFAGTIIKSGSILVRAEKIGSNTTVSKIINMVDDAANNKAQIQIYADKFSAQLIPLNFILAGIVYMSTKDITRALNMLIIDYSCGVRLSTATALSAVIHTSAKNGVLLKGGNIVETMSEADTIILDKTGTMTEGKPKLVSIIANGDLSKKELVEFAGAAEETSTHPLAHPILEKIKKSGWTIPEHTEPVVHISRGIETRVDEKVIRVGNAKFMNENNIDLENIENEANRLVDRGENVLFVSRDDNIIGILGVHDTVRGNMKKAINRLRYLGFDDVKLLTGDLNYQAEAVASRMAMDGYESELLPEDKARYILNCQSGGSKVIMVGDGINDAPALAFADIGMSIGSTKTDIAMEASDVTITSDNPLLIPSTVVISRRAMSIIKQNFATTIGVNTVGLFLGAIGVLPVFWGAVLHNLTTILVVMNSGRLLFYDFEGGRR